MGNRGRHRVSMGQAGAVVALCMQSPPIGWEGSAAAFGPNPTTPGKWGTPALGTPGRMLTGRLTSTGTECSALQGVHVHGAGGLYAIGMQQPGRRWPNRPRRYAGVELEMPQAGGENTVGFSHRWRARGQEKRARRGRQNPHPRLHPAPLRSSYCEVKATDPSQSSESSCGLSEARRVSIACAARS